MKVADLINKNQYFQNISEPFCFLFLLILLNSFFLDRQFLGICLKLVFDRCFDRCVVISINTNDLCKCGKAHNNEHNIIDEENGAHLQDFNGKFY